MAELFAAITGLLFVNLALGVWRLARGPSAADRIAASALFGTVGVAALVLMGATARAPALHDVALVLVILAAATAMVVARGDDPGGA